MFVSFLKLQESQFALPSMEKVAVPALSPLALATKSTSNGCPAGRSAS